MTFLHVPDGHFIFNPHHEIALSPQLSTENVSSYQFCPTGLLIHINLKSNVRSLSIPHHFAEILMELTCERHYNG